ncbi:MAG: hypothetical protein R3B72_03375 [Polyangiaceae bacterium]
MEAVKGMLSNMSAFQEMVAQQQKVVEEAKAQEAADDAAQRAAAAAAAKQRTKLGAAVDCAYVIAAADGATTNEELSHISSKLSTLTSDAIDGNLADELVGAAAYKVSEKGRDAVIADVASILGSQEEREAAFMIAAAVSWTGGGIGTQEGLALQAISKAFGWEMNAMHKLLGKARA